MSISPGYRFKRKLLRLAVQPNGQPRGVDHIANGATPIAMQTKGLTVTPYESETVTRDLDDGLNGHQPVIHVNEMMTISGSVEVTAAALATQPVPYSAIFEMAGYAVNVDDDVSYTRILDASSEKDGTLYFNWDGIEHRLIGARMNLTFAGKINELMYFNFEAKGLYGGTIEQVRPTANFSAFLQPLPMNNVNNTLTLDGQALNCFSFEENLGNTIERDEGTESLAMFIDDWATEGTFMIEAATLGTFDPFAIVRSNAIIPYEFAHGPSGGRQFIAQSTGIQLMPPSPAEYKGKLAWDLPYRVIRGHETVFRSV